jgi:NarL family two-component system response regulator LiaR
MASFRPSSREDPLPLAARLGLPFRCTADAKSLAKPFRSRGEGVAPENLLRSRAPVAAPSLIRIVVADSRPMVVRGLTELINARKPLMEVVAWASGYARTIELSEYLRPEVIVFSFFRDAIDAIEALAALIHRSQAKVLLIKGQDDAAPIGRAIELGARGVVLAEDTSEAIVQAIIRVSRVADEPGTAWLGGLARLSVSPHTRARLHAAEHARTGRLTPRERQLIQVIVDHPSAKYMAIGSLLGISEHTVHNHLTSIYQKLGLVNRIELLVYAVKHLIDENGDPAVRRLVDLD